MLRTIILLTILLSINSYSLDREFFYNEFVGINGIHEIDEYDIIFTNSSSFYILDKETGKHDPLTLQEDLSLWGEYSNFFHYQGDLYTYGGPLLKIDAGLVSQVDIISIVPIANAVTAHFVKGDTLWLFCENEPKLQMMVGENITPFNLNNSGGSYLTSNFLEFDGRLFGYMRTHLDAMTLVVEIVDGKPRKIISQDDPDNGKWFSRFPQSLIELDNELCLFTGTGFYKYNGENDFELLNFSHPLNGKQIKSVKTIDKSLYGIDTIGIFRYDNNEVSYLYNVTSSKQFYKTEIVSGKNKVYFKVDERYFTYDKEADQISEIDLHMNDYSFNYVYYFQETIDENLILSRENEIQIYKDGKIDKYFGRSNHFSNNFTEIKYDYLRDKLVLVSHLVDDRFIIQTFDGENWERIDLPREYDFFNEFAFTGLLIDKEGNYYVGGEEFFGIWDGVSWIEPDLNTEFGFNPNIDTVRNPEVELVCIDSLNNAWVAAQLWRVENNYSKSYYGLFKISNAWVELIEINDFWSSTNSTIGICRKNGSVVLTGYEKFYQIQGSYVETLYFEDPDPLPLIFSPSSISEDLDSNLIFSYSPSTGWDHEYGTYNFRGGISSFDGDTWEHDVLDDYIEPSLLDNKSILYFHNDFNDQFAITNTHVFVINRDLELTIYENPGIPIWNYTAYAINEEDFWIANSRNGLYKYHIPELNSISKKQEKNFLEYSIVENGILEINEIFHSYTILASNGQIVKTGGFNSKLDVSAFSSGQFFIVIQKGDEYFFDKFIVVK